MTLKASKRQSFRLPNEINRDRKYTRIAPPWFVRTMMPIDGVILPHGAIPAVQFLPGQLTAVLDLLALLAAYLAHLVELRM